MKKHYCAQIAEYIFILSIKWIIYNSLPCVKFLFLIKDSRKKNSILYIKKKIKNLKINECDKYPLNYI